MFIYSRKSEYHIYSWISCHKKLKRRWETEAGGPRFLADLVRSRIIINKEKIVQTLQILVVSLRRLGTVVMRLTRIAENEKIRGSIPRGGIRDYIFFGLTTYISIPFGGR